MRLSLEDTTKLTELGEIASDLLVKIMDADIQKEAVPTDMDILFKRTLTQIYSICPLLSDGYIKMYNYIQKQKIGPESEYLKIMRINHDSREYSFKRKKREGISNEE
jgi:hypothetical protein